MHARGVGYESMVLEGGDRQMLYEGSSWENVPVGKYDPGLAVTGGSAIEWTCSYQNTTTTDINQGPRSTDEMCMLIGSYYPARPEVSLCSYFPDEAQNTNFLGAEWIGKGTETCAASLSCFQSNISGGNMFEALASVTTCINASDPAVSSELSGAIGCILASFTTGKDFSEECGPAITACTAK